MKNPEGKSTMTESNLCREIDRNFDIMSFGGLVAGALLVYVGRETGWGGYEGFGYGVLSMDAFMNATYRGLRCLQGKGRLDKN